MRQRLTVHGFAKLSFIAGPLTVIWIAVVGQRVVLGGGSGRGALKGRDGLFIPFKRHDIGPIVHQLLHSS